ncbi:MAG: Xaa-Pro peptidase family protein [Candidatus Altiarchaeota archaeon]|nr:Xaa-Pro peptidase family protein [Candidatus Altiarchaeota archaeon]MBU4341602.1 Xaa-Pro peptidase family protein [Candidatus Altiarchaeota archaeon]MBU4436914.1 Xaa-Pro peptidase family protein [Candidatus Altiarchaeota archaeon]
MSIEREIGKRLGNLRESLESEGIDAILLSNPNNIRYLTGKETGRVLISRESSVIWVRELYLELYSFSPEFDVRADEEDAVRHYIKDSNIKKLAVENLLVSLYERRKEELGIELVPTNTVERLRAVKSDYELELLRNSASIAKKGMEKAYEIIKDGTNELDAVADIEYVIRKAGSETPPFMDGMLLASGPDGADIHARARMKKVMATDLVVVDLGARVDGYYSDMTRTIPVGEPNPLAADILEFIENLQAEAIDRIHPGVRAGDIHDFVSKEIENRGYKFYHSTGHGIGLDVHELPNIGPKSEDALEPGMAFTIEPGIYIPGKFGVRFEDTLSMKKNKIETLTG